MRGGLGRGSEGSSMDRDSLEDFTAEELLVLATEDIQGQLDNLEIAGEEEDDASCSDTKSLIVTNVDLVVFTEPLAKAEFESRFSVFDPDIIFYYIRTFRRYSSLNFQNLFANFLFRVRIDFSCRSLAATAKTSMDTALVGGNTVHVYWLRMCAPSTGGDVFLAPPPLEKQFLISPPCSPPVGWEQPREGGPVVDYDLLAAVAQLGPGDNHELQPSKSVTICGQELTAPSIVVQVCEGGGVGDGRRQVGKIVQTRRPDRQSSIED